LAALFETLGTWVLALGAGLVLAIGSAHATDYCTKNSGAAAVDTSVPVDDAFLRKMKEVGVGTIIRYYDHVDETIRGKTLHKSERDLIASRGFAIAVVFQHYNQRFTSFTPERGAADAERSLVLAEENSQPRGSAIYFGVDGGWKTAKELANIEAYFRVVGAGLAGSGYRIGVYGSGLVCRTLLGKGLAELCWLSNARTWPEYEPYRRSLKWKLLQRLESRCAGRGVDFNLTNGADTDFGQFGP
jgi:hypothetical protein